MRLQTLLFLLLSCLSQLACGQTKLAEIAIIIDDMGNKHEDAAAFTLPAGVTFAILPNKPLSEVFSNWANQQDREVILHMPMESLAGVKEEQGAIRASMSQQAMLDTLQSALNTVPHATGLNNHMGSKLTQLEHPMAVTMDFLSRHGLYFVDSRTTSLTRAEHIARQSGIMASKRNVFLDHDADPQQIERQFKRLIRLAKLHGRAVAIAHPYPQTLNFLAEQLTYLDQQGVSLVKLGDVVRQQYALAKQPSYPPTSTATLK